jgi:insulysin
MSDEEFETEKQALITKKLEKPKQLIAFSKKLLYEIDTKQYNFDRDQIEVQALQKLTKDDVIAFFKVITI